MLSHNDEDGSTVEVLLASRLLLGLACGMCRARAATHLAAPAGAPLGPSARWCGECLDAFAARGGAGRGDASIVLLLREP
ncbi:hypothetical protein HK405_009061 [Cladochytrium tenue]|nr:hypothetical protein HK405_009061 [Cladochytrium tenue]